MNFKEMIQSYIYTTQKKLQDLPHIKKYNEVRRLHTKVNQKMGEYFLKEYDYEKYSKIIEADLQKETKGYQFKLNLKNPNDEFILYELTALKNHPGVPAITEIFLKEKRYQNEEEKNFLESLVNSHASLFKIVKSNIDTGYITMEDVFTKERYNIIDVTLSISLFINNNPEMYMYNRIVLYNGVRFATGIPCIFYKMTKPLQKLIKECEEKNYPSYSRCIRFYNLSKLAGNISLQMNTRF